MDERTFDDYQALSVAGARIVAGCIARKPDATLVVATGSTPMGVYRELAAGARRQELSAESVTIFQLDEYLGVQTDDPRSLYRWMRTALLDPLDIAGEHVVRLPGDARDAEAVCREYDRRVEEAGGFDLAILGLGLNGHLGFNEPPSAADAPTRVVRLTEESRRNNARYWGGELPVPPLALTCGMMQLLSARATLLLVSGEHKADILRKTVSGPVTPDVPASFLQRAPHVQVLADRQAAALLPR